MKIDGREVEAVRCARMKAYARCISEVGLYCDRSSVNDHERTRTREGPNKTQKTLGNGRDQAVIEHQKM